VENHFSEVKKTTNSFTYELQYFFSIDENPEASTPHPIGFYVVLSDFRTHHGILKIGVFYAHLLIFSVQ